MRLIKWVAVATLVFVACACVEDQGQSGTGMKASAKSDSGVTAEPGIDVRRISVGLPSRTMDFIGDDAVALAGAEAGNKIFFGIRDEDVTHLYCRDLQTFERSQLTEISDFIPGSLVASPDGRFLAYSRGRRAERYIEDPGYRYPETIAVPYLIDLEQGKEFRIFDFREPEWLPYRTDSASLFISPDGERIVMLSYNVDRLLMVNQTAEWQQYDKDLTSGQIPITAEEITEGLETLRLFYDEPLVHRYFREIEFEPPTSGSITDEEREAIAGLQEDMKKLEGVLLIYENDEARMLPLNFDEDPEEYLYRIFAMGNDNLVLSAQRIGSNKIEPTRLYTVDVATGDVHYFSEFLGSAGTTKLDDIEQHLMVVYNPVDLDNKLLMTETRVLSLPLDGGEMDERVVPGDYVAYVDITADGRRLVGQQSSENDIYLVDIENSSRQLLTKMLGPVKGLFVNTVGDTAVYLESGVLYAINIPPSPVDSAAEWTAADRFEQYESAVREFFTAIGYVVPENAQFEWEERYGFGGTEISIGISNPDKPGTLALARYSVDDEQLVSIWYPTGIPFESAGTRGSQLDYYECKDIAEDVLAKVGWLNPESWEVYQPGPNPLYDARSDSFILVFRDGYWLDEEDMENWVYSSEATLRIRASDGQIPEMTLLEQDRIMDQQLSISMERAVFLIRNQEDGMVIPEGAPVRFDTDNYRLIVGKSRKQLKGPGLYEGPTEGRLCYEIDAYIQPEEALIMTTLVDTENGDILGSIDYQPTTAQPTTETGH